MSRRDVIVLGGTWAELTEGNVSALRLQNQGPGNFKFFGVVGQVQPANTQGGILVPAYQGHDSQTTLAYLFPDTPAANRVYAYAEQTTTISVCHL